MIRSMTAFARQEAGGDWGELVCELRSVNHRYLELSLRLPEELRALETGLRERAAQVLGRGKVEINLRYRSQAGGGDELELDAEQLARLRAALNKVARGLSDPAPISPLEVLRWPGVVQERQTDLEPVQAAAAKLFDRALAELSETRIREGAQIRDLLLARLDAMQPLVEAARERLPQVRERIRDKLNARVRELVEVPDTDRLEQELAYLAQKLDVDEELDRLTGHIAEVRRVLGRDEPVGRRLDFLMQELNREANTLGSKSADSETTNVSVELKVLIEQMREQIQNVE
ncbi:YicC/YloC family endoribonuclease [Thiohalobacter thiocyanaticus]|uniref:YicC family protein n=1 Tax=Thiohalobacter thiocyanaticus TaxID=585455 RepID=A0A426QK06_9GAMM|nr:YicC/YloC family endoribonuclease [Thiohalobacter thiocyanaticus]RRQ22093.1 YicC family protein [Thiohalobacter thiocyanaticus]